MNKKKIIISGLILAALLVGGSSLMNSQLPKTTEAQAAPRSTAVELQTVAKGNIEQTIFTIGSIDPETIYNINAQTPGKVDAVYFEIGDTVKKDDILFKMDTDAFDINKNSALTQLSNNLENSKLNYNQAKDNFEDQKTLYSKGLISKLEFDNAQKSFDQAQIQYNNSRTDYQSKVSSFGDQLESYVVKSSVSGIIIGKTISANQYASTQNGFSIIENDKLKINSSIASKYVHQISPGQKVDIYVNTIDKTYQGTVESVSYVAQQGAYPIEVSIESDGAILPGMYAELNIHTKVQENSIIVPKDSIITEEGKTYIYTTKDGQTANKTEIQTGSSDRQNIEITQGITEGQQIITQGKEYLDEGTLIMTK